MKKILINGFFVILGFALFTSCPPVPVEEFIIPNPPQLWYYVASWGSDSNDGFTEKTPFKTFRYACETAARDPDSPRVFLLDFLDSDSEGIASPAAEIFLLDGNTLPRALTLGGLASAGLKGGTGYGAALSLVNGAQLTVRNITVRESSGAGISVDGGSSLVMESGGVEENALGVVVLAGSRFFMAGGVIKNNRYILTGGPPGIWAGGVTLRGLNSSFTMTGDSLVTGNYSQSGVGGVGGQDNAVFIMRGNSRVSDNIGSNVGLLSGSLTMEDNASVALSDAGIDVDGSLTMRGNSLVTGALFQAVSVTGRLRMSENARIAQTAGFVSRPGPAVSVIGSCILEGNAAIADNAYTGLWSGAGLTIITDNAVISGNCRKGRGPSNNNGFAAVHFEEELIINKNAQIRDNYEAGVFHVGSGSGMAYLTITGNAVISGNRNGGVYANYCDVILSGSARISLNTARGPGGGVYLGESSRFTMSGEAQITNNTSGLDSAGAIAAGGGVYLGDFSTQSASFLMLGGTISGNTALAASSCGYGGGVAVTPQSAFTLRGGTISGNTAHRGGGVALFPVRNTYPGYSYADTGAVFHMEGGSITDNRATASGGGVALIPPSEGTYTGDNDTTLSSPQNVGRFSMTGGVISKNTASAQGGGLRVGSPYHYTVTKSAAAGCVIFGSGSPDANTAAVSAGAAAYVEANASASIIAPIVRDATINSALGDYASW